MFGERSDYCLFPLVVDIFQVPTKPYSVRRWAQKPYSTQADNPVADSIEATVNAESPLPSDMKKSPILWYVPALEIVASRRELPSVHYAKYYHINQLTT
jgi:hypothetical protein